MRRLFLSAVTIAFIFSAFSCKKDEQPIQPITNLTKTDSIPIAAASKTEELVLQIIKETQTTKAQLTKSNAVVIYQAFRAKIEELLGDLNTENTALLEEYYNYYNQEQQKVVLPDSVKTKIKLFSPANIEIWDIGEGMTEIRTVPEFYLNLFKNYLPQDQAAFLKLEAFDSTELYDNDGGFAISLTQVSQRVLNWEQFLVQYPNSTYFDKAKVTYKHYLQDYLYGLDNTSNFEPQDLSLNTESKEEFDRFIAKNPNTVTTKILKAMLTCLQRRVTPEELDAVIHQEEAKYAITL